MFHFISLINTEHINFLCFSRYKFLVEIMIAKEIGCEYLQLSYPFNISESGFCIISNFEDSDFVKSMVDKTEFKGNVIKALGNHENFSFDLKKINLSEQKYEIDNNLIKKDCACFTCTKGYSRAYIHHLIKCNELNGKILVIM